MLLKLGHIVNRATGDAGAAHRIVFYAYAFLADVTIIIRLTHAYSSTHHLMLATSILTLKLCRCRLSSVRGGDDIFGLAACG